VRNVLISEGGGERGVVHFVLTENCRMCFSTGRRKDRPDGRGGQRPVCNKKAEKARPL